MTFAVEVSEMRLIDADAFEANMQNEWERNEISNGEWIRFREMLNAEPTIEIDRKRGKWVKKAGSDLYYCSECDLPSLHDWRYCERCGADMRSEDDYCSRGECKDG